MSFHMVITCRDLVRLTSLVCIVLSPCNKSVVNPVIPVREQKKVLTELCHEHIKQSLNNKFHEFLQWNLNF